MSGLSLYGDFFKAAAQAKSGAVRLAPGSGDKLVNTGTLGGRTVSVTRNDPDKAGSRQKTLDAFKGALARGPWPSGSATTPRPWRSRTWAWISRARG